MDRHTRRQQPGLFGRRRAVLPTMTPRTSASEARTTVNGAAIRVLRHTQKIAISGIQEKAGISPGHLSRLERGLCGASDDVVKRIARLLGVRVSAITIDRNPQQCTPIPNGEVIMIVRIARHMTARDIQKSTSRTTGFLSLATPRAGIHPGHLSRLERGLCGASNDVLDRIADALGVPIAAIVRNAVG